MKENNSWPAITVFATSLFTFLILHFSFCLAQHSKFDLPKDRSHLTLDSLYTALRNATHDTTRASTLVALTEEFYLSNPDTVIPLCRQAMVLIENNLPKANQKEKLSFLKTKALALNNIGYNYDNKGDTSNALDYYHKSLKIQKEIGNKRGIAASFNNIGVVYNNQGDIPNALEYYHKALKIQEETGDKQDIAYSLNNIGMIYNDQGDIPSALDYHHKALQIREEIGDKLGVATSLNNMGLIYDSQGDIPSALDYHHRSLKIREEIGDKQGIAYSLNNIGYIYNKQGDIPNTLDYYHKALQIRKEIGDKKGISYSLNNIGYIYANQGDIAGALDYFHQALKIQEETGDKRGIANSLNNIGSIYLKQVPLQLSLKERAIMIDSALAYSGSSLALAKETGYAENIRNTENALSKIYSQKGDYQNAFNHYRQYIIFRDSINNENTRKMAMKKQMQYEFEKKAAVMQKEQEKQTAVAAAESRRQKIIIWFIAAVAMAVAAIAIIIYRSLQVTKKQKKFIELQKGEIEKQKKIVEEKNTDIIDSIEYAKLIQDAVMTTEENLKELLPESFVLYKPRDIVSGDFFWTAPLTPEGGFNSPPSGEQGDFRLAGAQNSPSEGRGAVFAVCDCTGHGVPGAFMSMMGNILLNEIVLEKKIWDPAEILNQLRKEIIRTLHQGGSSRSRDGMDISLCILNTKALELEFAGANNPCYIVSSGLRDTGYEMNTRPVVGIDPKPETRNPKLIVLDANRMPIGFEEGKEKIPFTGKKIQLQPGDTIYLSSDGFEDQLGGPKEKKLTSKRFRDILQRASEKDIRDQKIFLESALNNWKSTNDQMDDICVMGVRV